MTSQGLAYLNYIEGNRHNVATESQARQDLSETVRHNKVYETETNRHNVATESETSRHNMFSEKVDLMNAYTNRAGQKETARHNKSTEGQARRELKETTRHNKRTESISDADRQEKTRHNKVSEAITSRYNDAMVRIGDQKVYADLYKTQVGANTAAANRAMTERVASADRRSRQSIASADRKSKQSIATLDRTMKLEQNRMDYALNKESMIRSNRTKENVAKINRQIADKRVDQDDINSKRRLVTDLVKGAGSIMNGIGSIVPL